MTGGVVANGFFHRSGGFEARRSKLEAEVEDSYQLRRWLMGFGVEILEPKSLRSDFRDMAKNLRRMYKK